MKVKVWYETGYVNCGQSETIEIPEEEFEGCDNDAEREAVVEEYARDWFFDQVGYGFKVVD